MSCLSNPEIPNASTIPVPTMKAPDQSRRETTKTNAATTTKPRTRTLVPTFRALLASQFIQPKR